MLNLIKTFAKAIINYFKKNAIRSSGVFGISGSIKSYGGFRKVIKNKKGFDVIKKIATKNVLKSFHGTNVVLNLKKFGWDETLKRVAKNKLVPMEVRKLGWFYNSLKKEVGKDKLKKEIRKELLFNANKTQIKINNINSKSQVDIIDRAYHMKPKTKGEKEIREEIVNKTIVFNVNSPETHNFSQRLHFYNMRTRDYTIPLRGWGQWGGVGKRTKYYTYHNIQWKYVKSALLKVDYGHLVFNKIR